MLCVRILFVGGVEKTYEEVSDYKFDDNQLKFKHVMIETGLWKNKPVKVEAHIVKSQVMSVEFFEVEA